jgi:hypothetical protein
MPSDRKQLRGTVLAEDPRTERFFRALLVHLGFDKHKLRFRTAPQGRGDAKVWIRAQSQYPFEVKLLRQKKQQLFLVAVMDGDNEGVTAGKQHLDAALSNTMQGVRQKGESIATPVPTWSIETWLLALLGDENLDETVKTKLDFQNRFPGKKERRAVQDAAEQWRNRAARVPTVPSLADGKIEMRRIDPA